MDPKDYERLAKMEAHVEQMNAVVIRMEAKLDTWSTNFLTRNEATEMFRSRDQDIQETRGELKELRDEIKAVRGEITAIQTDQQNDKRASAAQVSSWVGIAVAALSLLVAYFK